MIMSVTLCFFGSNAGCFELEFKEEFFSLPPTRNSSSLSINTSNCEILLDFGISDIAFDFNI